MSLSNTRDLVGQRFDRAAEVRAIDDRTVEVAFASEEPYLRWFGWEVIDMRGMDMSRLQGGASVLVNHDQDKLVGVVESARVDRDNKARARIRLGRSALASEVAQDITDGIRRHISFGYEILDAETDGERDGAPVYRVKAKPFEISFVSVPADASVGVGRSHEEQKMSDVQIGRESGNEAERVRQISSAAHQFKKHDLGQRAIAEGWPMEKFQAAVIDSYSARPVQTQSGLGLTDGEVRSFSFVRLLRTMAFPQDRRTREAAGFELSVVEAADRGEGWRIPSDILRAGWKRDLTVGGTTTGQKLVGTDHLGGSFIEMLRDQLVLREAGATILEGLRGNVAIPRQSGGSSWTWVAEGNPVGEQNPQFDQISLQPKTGGAFVDVSRKLLLQSDPSIEQLIRSDFVATAARGIDFAGLFGNPDVTATANSPRGVAYTTGIGSVSVATNGSAPSRTIAVNLAREVAVDNANRGSLAYVTNSRVVSKMMDTLVDAGSGRFLMEEPDRLVGRRLFETNAVPSNITVGSGSNLSAMLYGNWADCVLGIWDHLSIISDPYTGGTAGTLRLICLSDIDVAVRHPQSFSMVSGLITT